MAEKMLIFDLVGSIAHFRKFYTNSSSLSYAFPPRTVIVGLLAGMLGEQRDSYYEKFNLEICQIAVSIRTPVRKLIQTVKYLNTNDKNKGYTQGEGTLVPLEWVLPLPKRLQEIRYRLYVSHKKLNDQLAEAVSNPKYPPYLGLTECPGHVELIGLVDETSWQSTEVDSPQNYSTVIPTKRLEGNLRIREGVQILKEKIPLDFDKDRKIRAIADILYERNAHPIEVKISGQGFHVTYTEPSKDTNISEWGVFLS